MLVQRWTSKPWLGVGLDWTHPLTKELVGCYVFNEQSGGFVYNLGSAGPRNDGVLTNSPTWVGASSGGGIACTSTAPSYIDLGQFTEFASASNVSLFGLGHRVAGTVWQFGISSGASHEIDVQIWSDNVYYMLIGSEYPTSALAAPTGNFSVGLTFDGSQAQAARAQSYINGSSAGAGSVVATTVGSATTHGMIGTVYGVAGSNGRFDLVLMWGGRTLTARDMSDLHTNPWQIFQPNTSYWLYQSTGPPSYTGSANIAAAGTLSATGLVTAATGSGGITASGSLAATGLATYTGSVGIIASGTLEAIGLVTAAIGVAEISAAATIEATGEVSGVFGGSGEIIASGTLTATGLVTAATGVAGITASGSLAATGLATYTGSGEIIASGTIAATGVSTGPFTGSAGITASGSLAATGLVTSASGVAGITATGTISAIGISSSAVVIPEIYPDPFAATLLTTFTPFSAVLSTNSTPFGAISVIGQVTSPKLTGRWYHIQSSGVTVFNTQQLQATFPVAVSEGSLIVVGLGNDLNGGTFTVSDNINNTPYAVAISGGGSLSSGTSTLLWYIVPQGGGGYPFTVTFDSQYSTYPAMSIDEYIPPVGSVPSVENEDAAEGNSTVATLASPLTITQMDLVVATCKAWGAAGQTITAGGGFQPRYDVTWSSSPPVNGLITADQLNTNINTNPSFSLDPGSNWVMASAAFTPVSTHFTGSVAIVASGTIEATGVAAGPFAGSAEITASSTIEATGLAFYTFMLLGLI